MKNLFVQYFIPAAAVLFLSVMLAGCGKASGPEKITVNFTGPVNMTMSYNGKELKGVTRKVLPGTYVFKFNAPGCKPVWKKVNISAKDNNSEIPVNFEEQRSAAIISCFIRGKSGDPGAKVICNGDELGTTPCLITDLPRGKHEVTVSYPGYAGKTIQLAVDGGRLLPMIRCELISISGKLRVNGHPEGAQLFINGKLVGSVPFTGDMNYGKYLLELRAPGFISRQQEIDFSATSGRIPDIVLSPEPSTLEIKSEPSNAVCFINSEKMRTTPLVVNNLRPGNYRIRLELPGYEPCERTVEVTPGSHETVHIALESGFGSARLYITPAGSDVYVDGKEIGRVKSDPSSKGNTLPFLVSNLTPGTHLCRIVHPRGTPSTMREFKFVVKKNRTTECPPMEIWVADCEIVYRNGLKAQGKLIRADHREVEFYLPPSKASAKSSIIMTEKRDDIIEVRMLPER